MKLALNLGCGTKLKVPGQDGFDDWVNADVSPGPGIHVVRDFRRGLPFADEHFDHVFADNVLEHFASDDVIQLVNELDRVIKVGGTLRVIVPHFQSQGACQDPTHKSLWAPRTFLYLNQVDTPYGGRSIGVTANFVPIEGPTVHGDMETEAFIAVLLRKMPQ